MQSRNKKPLKPYVKPYANEFSEGTKIIFVIVISFLNGLKERGRCRKYSIKKGDYTKNVSNYK